MKQGGKDMKNKRKAVGFILTAVVFALAGILVGLIGELPSWFGMIADAIAAVAGVFGIYFVAPGKGE